MAPMGSQRVAKGRSKDALAGAGVAKSAQGLECPGKGQGDHFFGVPFGTPIWLHFCSRSGIFSLKKVQVFKYQKGSKMDPKMIPFLVPNLHFFE